MFVIKVIKHVVKLLFRCYMQNKTLNVCSQV